MAVKLKLTKDLPVDPKHKMVKGAIVLVVESLPYSAALRDPIKWRVISPATFRALSIKASEAEVIKSTLPEGFQVMPLENEAWYLKTKEDDNV